MSELTFEESHEVYNTGEVAQLMKIISIEESEFLPEDVCVGCNLCELACSLFHDDVVNPRRSRIQIHRTAHTGGASGNYWDYPVLCRQCEHVYCVEACPVDCFTVNPATGTFDVVPEECIGCTLCVEACPWGEIFMDPQTNIAIKCDLCGDEDPKCVEICPSDVLKLVEVEVSEGFRPVPVNGGMAYGA